MVSVRKAQFTHTVSLTYVNSHRYIVIPHVKLMNDSWRLTFWICCALNEGYSWTELAGRPGDSSDRPVGSTGSHSFWGRRITRMRLFFFLSFAKTKLADSIVALLALRAAVSVAEIGEIATCCIRKHNRAPKK